MNEAEREEDKDRAKQHMKEEVKICPFLTIKEDHIPTYIACRKRGCALYVDIVKDSSNPFYYGEYHGCGLLPNLPYVIVKRKL